MINKFDQLSSADQLKLIDALPLITLLVAGSDGKIDKKEKEDAAKLTHVRSFAKPDALSNYYKNAHEHFESRMQILMGTLPDDLEESRLHIIERLKDLNSIFHQINPIVADQLHESFQSFARHIARSSGGIFGIFSISSNEEEIIKLDMIQPRKG